MDLSNLDVVYFVKDSAFNEELKYSLRSVDANFPHNRVVFYGGKPIGVYPDLSFSIVQKGDTKWDKVRDMLVMACQNDELTEDIVLFNDDFFAMRPVTTLPYFVDGSLRGLIARVERKNRDRPTKYTRQLLKAVKALEEAQLGDRNYELHVPMIINRKRMLEVREKFPGVPASRSLYGNLVGSLICVDRPDVKIVDRTAIPSNQRDFLSTSDNSFSSGRIGEYIRAAFPKKSRFER